jgi:hypothetical protein
VSDDGHLFARWHSGRLGGGSCGFTSSAARSARDITCTEVALMVVNARLDADAAGTSSEE